MTRRHRLLLVFGALIATGSAQAAGWRSYHNDRFGTSADYPQGWAMGAAPQNDDGRMFTSPIRKPMSRSQASSRCRQSRMRLRSA